MEEDTEEVGAVVMVDSGRFLGMPMKEAGAV